MWWSNRGVRDVEFSAIAVSTPATVTRGSREVDKNVQVCDTNYLMSKCLIKLQHTAVATVP